MNSFVTLLADFAEKTGVTPEASGANSFDVVAWENVAEPEPVNV